MSAIAPPSALPSFAPALLTVREAADYLALSERAVWQQLERGDLPRVRLGRATRVRRADLDALIARLAESGRAVTP